ncbi:carboxypeptidase-like regulatory domain-containing protein [Paraflavitalea speifideaquila]|uniref:carboxypeptidase-like regulatory domain-containing protein n=1 Tax=Paraflavitalea speifideaquila TaxID=3076558 RepID=UPI0028E6AB9B|nr:carboxypeptidase-like regulatory domain-containing protein [Paraflavitalea speifideiaquila]
MKQFHQCTKLVCCLLWLLLAHQSFSQEKQPAVKGIIKDESGAPLPSVSVMVQNKNTQFSASTQTSPAGVFVFSTLDPGGPYTFTFSFVGYEKKYWKVINTNKVK